MELYQQFSEILYQVIVNRKNIKQVVYTTFEDNLNFKKQALAVVSKAVRHFTEMKDLHQKLMDQDKKMKIKNVFLFAIFIVELFISNRKKIQGGGKLKQILMENKEFIEQVIKGWNTSQENYLIKSKVSLRYIGFKSSEDFINKYQVKAENDVLIKDLIHVEYDQYQKIYKGVSEEQVQQEVQSKQNQQLNKDFIVQSFSSCIPPQLCYNYYLENKNIFYKKFDIIDCCSAPGNKTLQLAEYFGQKVCEKVFAFELEQKRFEMLQNRMQFYGFENVIKSLHQNFLSTDQNLSEFEKVQIIQADPTCSGSGMKNIISQYHQNDKQNSKEEFNDLRSLSKKIYKEQSQETQNYIKECAFNQLQILLKCIQFPSTKLIIYSTCSIYCQENEQVVQNFLENQNLFSLYKIPSNNSFSRGFEDYPSSISDKVVRIDPFKTNNDGFFVAMFIRNQ